MSIAIYTVELLTVEYGVSRVEIIYWVSQLIIVPYGLAYHARYPEEESWSAPPEGELVNETEQEEAWNLCQN